MTKLAAAVVAACACTSSPSPSPPATENTTVSPPTAPAAPSPRTK